jgi:hypothetical protein
MLIFTPRGFVSVRAAIADYPGVAALVCVRRRIVIINTAARKDAKIIQLHFGLPDPG